MANKKIHLSWHLNPSELDEEVVQFYVEAKPDKKWIQVGGPFPDRDSANIFAQQYSSDNPDIQVQVVVYQ